MKSIAWILREVKIKVDFLSLNSFFLYEYYHSKLCLLFSYRIPDSFINEGVILGELNEDTCILVQLQLARLQTAEIWRMAIFVAEGLDNEIVLQVLQQPFEALSLRALDFGDAIPIAYLLKKIVCLYLAFLSKIQDSSLTTMKLHLQ